MNNTFTVYCHTNKTNGKKYIGITSKDPKIRWNKGLGYKKGQYFGKIIEIYGWDNFEHEILFQTLSKEEAQEKEIELIKLYKTNNPKFGYNRSKGGEFDNESLMIKVNQYDLDGNFIKTWNSQIEVAEFLGIHPSNISHSIGRNTQTNGFIFKKYEGNTNNIEPYNKKLVYTGDLGNCNLPKHFTDKFVPIEKCDILIGETTYADGHRPRANSKLRKKDIEKLTAVIQHYCIETQSRILIPCFSLDRTPEMYMTIREILKENG